MSASTWMILLGLLFLGSGCVLRFGDPSPEEQLAVLEAELERSGEELTYQRARSLAKGLRTFGASPEVILTSDALLLKAAVMEGDLGGVRGIVEDLSDSLEEVPPEDQHVRLSTTDKARLDSEQSLRAAHEWAFEAWKKGQTEPSRQLMLRAGEVYLEHFGSALSVCEVLWRDAERMRLEGLHLEAVARYEEVIQRDFYGEYRDRAQESIVEVWSEGSLSLALPTDVVEAVEIPSPHREWIEIVRTRVAVAPEDPELRGSLLRVAEIELAYGHHGAAQETLLAIIDGAEDDFTVDAAVMLLECVAAESASSRELKRWRKELSERPFLGASARFASEAKRVATEMEAR